MIPTLKTHFAPKRGLTEAVAHYQTPHIENVEASQRPCWIIVGDALRRDFFRSLFYENFWETSLAVTKVTSPSEMGWAFSKNIATAVDPL